MTMDGPALPRPSPPYRRGGGAGVGASGSGDMKNESPPETIPISGSSPPQTLRAIFREEALAHKNRAVADQGEPLRVSAARLKWSLWILVALLAAGLALASRLDVVSGLVHGPSAPTEPAR